MLRSQITVRYMGLMAWWWVVSGVLYISYTREAPKALSVVDDAVSLQVWGGLMIVLGVLSVGAWLRPRAAGTRAVLSFSMGVKAAFATGLWLASSELWNPLTWSPGVPSYIMLAALDALFIRVRYIPARSMG